MVSKLERLLSKLKQKRKLKPAYNIASVVKKHSDSIALDLNPINENYHLLLSEPNVDNPFVIDSGLVRIIRNYVRFYPGREQRARAVFDWIEQNINYGRASSWFGPRYRNSSEVLRGRKGVCGEMAFLYITMSRSVGLQSNYVHVSRDFKKKKVEHACAVVYAGRNILVDPAYHKFDIHHLKYSILSDREVIERFRQWRC